MLQHVGSRTKIKLGVSFGAYQSITLLFFENQNGDLPAYYTC